MKCLTPILFLFVALSFTLFSCKKDTASYGSSTNKGVVPIPQNLMDYSYFKVGTWWVYQDSISGAMDSLYVTGSSVGMDTIITSAGLGYTGIFGWFNFKYANSGGFYYDQYCHTSYGLHSGRIPVFIDKGGPQYFSGEGTLLFSVFTDGVIAAYGHGNGQIEEDIYCRGTLDSFAINGQYFHNVVVFYNTWQVAENMNRTVTYLAKNVGIIKKQVLDSNQNWRLINYHVVQ